MKTSTRNARKSVAIAVPATATVTMQSVNDMIQQALAGILQAQTQSPVPPVVDKKNPARRPTERTKIHAYHTAVEKTDSGYAMLRIFDGADGRDFAFGIRKAKGILAVLSDLQKFVAEYDGKDPKPGQK